MCSFWEYFLFYGVLYIAWLEGVCYLLSQILSAFAREFRRQFQYILSSQLLSWKSWFCFFARSLARDSPICSRRHLSSKLIFFIPISGDEKGCYFRFRILANHLAAFFNLPVTECKHLLAFILTWICYFGREELTYSPIPLFKGQSSAAVSSNTEG